LQLTPGQRLGIDKVLAALNAAEAGPSEEDLSDAPMLDCWRPFFSAEGTPILWGIVSGHPRLRDNDQITTSQLVALDAENVWALNVSRWYRLAQPFSEFEAELVEGFNTKEASGFLQLDIPGFEPLDDRGLLTRLLTANGERIRMRQTARPGICGTAIDLWSNIPCIALSILLYIV